MMDLMGHNSIVSQGVLVWLTHTHKDTEASSQNVEIVSSISPAVSQILCYTWVNVKLTEKTNVNKKYYITYVKNHVLCT